MNAFSRSWEITKLSFKVMNDDKELIFFPILGGIFSILFFIAMVFPFVITAPLAEAIIGPAFYLALFGIYFGLAFIAIFFNTCVVYTVKKRFSGGNATFSESLKFAFTKIHLILGWSLISATVGLILRLLTEIAERMGTVGEIIMKVLISILGTAWSLIASFVIPGMVYHDIGPVDALKKSVHTIKKTWGESLIRHYGLGLVEFILLAMTVVGTIILAILFASVSLTLTYVIIGIGIIFTIGILAFFNVANTIFSTALFVYAEGGKIPHGYNSEVLKHAYVKAEEK
jgi:hypothetical protein